MIIIPAIDIQSGQCVRLLQGRKDDATVFSDDPAAMARRWVEAGAQLIHVVDLDGAFEKGPRNAVAIRAILDSVDVAVQVGGGIRDAQTIQNYLDAGVARVVIGTAAVRDPDRVRAICSRFPGRIVLGIDARNGMVAVEGWTETTPIRAIDLARGFEDCPVAATNFTDIHRDGMQTGVNIEETRRLAQSVSIPVVASGGICSLADIHKLLPLEAMGVCGVIVGRALYDGALDLKKAIDSANAYLAQRQERPPDSLKNT
jgi:phosphoribosylformimino-5-aminoimidazole carboxamide ribotide isomerase